MLVVKQAVERDVSGFRGQTEADSANVERALGSWSEYSGDSCFRMEERGRWSVGWVQEPSSSEETLKRQRCYRI